MQHKKIFSMLVITGTLIVVISGIALALTEPAHAQCGSQASSCKNCHEVQGQMPVNADGTAWHTSHAFGDFCYICHGGNQQATDKTTAHTGMVPPLSDTKASCAQCHPNDLQARAQVYADKLGIQPGTGSAPTASGSNGTTSATPTAASAAPAGSNSSATAQPASNAQAAPPPHDPNLVNYVQRYNENALGQHPINSGNIILLIIIGAMLVGGGALIVSHEGWLTVSLGPIKMVQGEYPADAVDMVPNIARLKPDARESLGRLLEKPEAIAEVLAFLDKMAERNFPEQKERKS